MMRSGVVALALAGAVSATEDPAARDELPLDLSHELASGGYIDTALRETATPIARPAEIPRAVMHELARIAGERDFKLAPPGSTTGTTRLDRRLRFAAVSKEFCIVGYDVITRSTASGVRVVLVHLYSPTYVRPLLVARCLDECRGTSDVRKALRRKRLVEYRPTYIDF